MTKLSGWIPRTRPALPMNFDLCRAVLAVRRDADGFCEDPYPQTWARRATIAPIRRRWPFMVRVIIALAWITAIYVATLLGFAAGLLVRALSWG